MNNDFPESYEEMINRLQKEGYISVIFHEKNKQRLKSSFDRINKTKKLLSNRNNFLGKSRYFIYGVWVGFIDIFFSPKDKGFEQARLIYTVAWRKISKYHGESLTNGEAKVTFYART